MSSDDPSPTAPPLAPSAPPRLTARMRAVLVDQVPRDHRQSAAAFRKRQLVVAAYVVAGAIATALTFRTEPDGAAFYAITLMLPAVWVAGAFSSGPLHLGAEPAFTDSRVRPIVTSIAIGLALAAVFVAGAVVVRQIPLLENAVDAVLEYAVDGTWPLVLAITVINGIAEELFFRGALYAAAPAGTQVAVTTVVYAVAVAASGNGMLGFAALVLGVVVGLERRATGGVLAPVLTHVTWSVTMLLVLPLLF